MKVFQDIKAMLLDNSTIRQTIFKNAFWLEMGIGINSLLKILLLIYAARILGATAYGKFSFALAFVSLFIIFHDFGLPSIITREFADEREKKEKFYSILSLKILLSIGTLFLILLGSFFITADIAVRRLILILALFALLNGFSTTFYAFFQARQRMEYQAWVEIFQGVLVTAIGLFTLFRFPSAQNLSYSYFFGSLGALILALIFFHFKIFSLRVSWQKSIWKEFLTMSWPLALVGLLGILYTYTDSIMMGYWGMITETGWFNAAQRISWTSFVLIGLVTVSFYPSISKSFKESKEKLQKIFCDQMKLMIALSFPLVIGGVTLAQRIIGFIYGPDFAPSILTFQILITAAGIGLLYTALQNMLIVSKHEKKIFWAIFAGAVVNIALNVMLIPRFSLYGAAFATLAAHLLLFFILLNLTLKLTPIHKENMITVLPYFLITVFSSIIMYFVISNPLIYYLHIFLTLPIGVIVYFSAFTILTMPIKSLVSIHKTE